MKNFFKNFFIEILLLSLIVFCILLFKDSHAITKREMLKLQRPGVREIPSLVHRAKAKIKKLEKEIVDLKKPKYFLYDIDNCIDAKDCQTILENKICFQGQKIKNLDLMKVYCAFNVH